MCAKIIVTNSKFLHYAHKIRFVPHAHKNVKEMHTKFESCAPKVGVARAKKVGLSGRSTKARSEAAAADWAGGQPDHLATAARPPWLPDAHGRQMAPR